MQTDFAHFVIFTDGDLSEEQQQGPIFSSDPWTSPDGFDAFRGDAIAAQRGTQTLDGALRGRYAATRARSSSAPGSAQGSQQTDSRSYAPWRSDRSDPPREQRVSDDDEFSDAKTVATKRADSAAAAAIAALRLNYSLLVGSVLVCRNLPTARSGLIVVQPRASQTGSSTRPPTIGATALPTWHDNKSAGANTCLLGILQSGESPGNERDFARISQ
jgi:hypothetical protein